MCDDFRQKMVTIEEEFTGKEWLVHGCPDALLLRFLDSRNGFQALLRMAKWRMENGLESIEESWRNDRSAGSLLLDKFWPVTVTGESFEGRLTVYLHLSCIDVLGLDEVVGRELIIRYNIYLLEALYRKNNQGGASLIVDLGPGQGNKTNLKINKVHAWMNLVLNLVTEISLIADANFPYAFGKVYFVRAPQFLTVLWKSVSRKMTQLSRTQVVLVADTSILCDAIPVECIPTCLGGNFVIEAVPSMKEEDLIVAAKEAFKLKSEAKKRRISLRRI